MDAIIAAGLVMMVAVAYAQVVRFEFVNYDDTVYVPDNPQVRDGFSREGIAWAFTTFETANWYPLSWLSLMLDCQWFGSDRPAGHHLMNAALHAANAVLLFIVLRRMTGLRWRSAAMAAIFAVHPLHVESVAWIAERKDVLSTLFFLLTLLAYGRYATRPTFARWSLVFLGMALGLMAKSMLVTLPAVLLLLDVWPLRRVGGSALGTRRRGPQGTPADKSEIPNLKSEIRLPPSPLRLFLEKLPLLLLSLAIAVVTVFAQSSKGATVMLDDRASLPIRLANAAIACVKYVAMFAWPADLAVYYPYNFHPSPALAAAAGLLVLSLTMAAVLCMVQSSRHSSSASYLVPLAVGWLWYVGTLVPVIGLVQVGSQAMADRYTYIPSIGISLVLVWGLADLARCLPGPAICRPIVLAAAATVIIAALLVATLRQAAYWIDSEQLFRHAVAVTGENPVACENLGDVLLKKRKQYAEAEAEFRKVLGMDAEHYAQTPMELAQAIAEQGRIAEAIAFVEAIPDKSRKALALNKLAMFVAPQGHVREAIGLLEESIELAPEQPVARRNLAWIYATCPDHGFRNGPKAVELALRACELSDWKNAACRQTLVDSYLEAGDRAHAVEELRSMIESNPTDIAAVRRLESLLHARQ
jgi:tetratricopeptide (TPR) repeat protein